MKKIEILSALQPVVDVLEEFSIPYYITGSIASSIYGTEFYFASPEDIIVSKLQWYKLGGNFSERQWLDVIGVIKIQGK